MLIWSDSSKGPNCVQPSHSVFQLVILKTPGFGSTPGGPPVTFTFLISQVALWPAALKYRKAIRVFSVQKAGSAPVNGDTVKTSAGAVFNVPICKVEHIKDAIFYLQGSGIKTVAATEKTNQNLYEVTLNEPVAIIMGSEDRGINPSVLKIVDEKAKLPMFGSIGSLNVSVACGAFLYEAVRQRS